MSERVSSPITYEDVAALAGERVRITYANADRTAIIGQRVGVVTTHDYGHTVDVRLDGHGGWLHGNEVKLEVMERRRYREVKRRAGPE